MINISVMNFILKNFKTYLFPLGLILILSFSRIIPHPPNFTPIIAVAIMSSYFFKNIYLSIATLLISMLLADLFIGFYENMIFVYASLLFINFIFYKIQSKINIKNLFIFCFSGSLIFFVISNFGFWYLGSLGVYNLPYEYNLKGLMECYVLAIPFFGNTFFSTIIFSYISFAASSILIKKLKYNI